MVQWLRFWASIAGSMVSIPGQGTEILYAAPWQRITVKCGSHFKTENFLWSLDIVSFEGSGATLPWLE